LKPDAERIVSRYPVGKVINVYYNQKSPDTSILKLEELGQIVIIGLIVGIILMSVGIGVSVILYKTVIKPVNSDNYG